MTDPLTAPCGTWASPITAARVAAGVRPVSAPRIVGARVLWLQSLPEQGGCMAVATRDGLVTPAPFNVRTRVHEYGGGALAAAGDTVWFSNFADNLVYAQQGDAAPVAITSDRSQRHADLELDARHQRLIAIREQHGGAGEPRNTIVALKLDGSGSTTLAEGADFYASARVSPEGRRLAWLQWNHPDMPWQGTELRLAAFADDGSLIHERRVAGGPGESLCQPAWAPDGKLHVVSDRSGFWNLYRLEVNGLVPVCPMDAEFGLPQWVFAQSSYGFNGPGEIIAACRENAISRLVRIDVRSGRATTIATPFEDIAELRVGNGVAVVEAGSPTMPTCIAAISLAGGAVEMLARSADDLPDASVLSVPRAISYPSAGGRTAHAFHYAPRNTGYRMPDGERPPLIVISHGGPTAMATNTLKLATQFWTSRGFAVLDVNYGGSTGFGRAYRQLLSGQWGIVDVEDCIAGAQFLVAQGLADGERLAIRGGSAGGFTTLAALAFHDVFKAGASHYGVGDLRALDADTHKFESRYTNDLLAPLPERERLYLERSPIHAADRLSCPVIFFQGLDDKVVPPAQAETMIAALRARGIPVAYLAFEGEGHGFRRKETVQRTLEAELSFYGQVFGFEAGDAGERVILS
ncbi:S9 family peptidase [Scleromatobacter humisilvae]|uniref:S9 family peptidase n=1 Tax=Scleromatobacter humisilvae TaxID=2897159 RepID=A0A9X1YNV7_9BURK|nr:S9 family peptidase [Scleromatobacter humisilvae]MCK9689262.1 S9 family peptidase [Scleromatobacter humisilvae]